MPQDMGKEIERLNKMGLLKELLKDKTTGENIVWATDAYAHRGKGYERKAQVLPKQITGKNAGVIKNRAEKEKEEQSERTKKHAEVFTPSWVCNQMNNYLDDEWFGKKGVFNNDGEPSKKKVKFPPDKTWHGYVENRVLEITCGEAPFLVSRYDMATGEEIEIEKRIGILDRKLRIVNENAKNPIEWREWVKRAYQATYGYEFQGDNLLIARVNMLLTFEEYMRARWQREPKKIEYTEIVNIIVWNIWQMDGLTGTIPYSEVKKEENQTLLGGVFEEGTAEDAKPPCKIFDWRENHSVTYLQLLEEGEKEKEEAEAETEPAEEPESDFAPVQLEFE